MQVFYLMLHMYMLQVYILNVLSVFIRMLHSNVSCCMCLILFGESMGAGSDGGMARAPRMCLGELKASRLDAWALRLGGCACGARIKINISARGWAARASCPDVRVLQEYMIDNSLIEDQNFMVHTHPTPRLHMFGCAYYPNLSSIAPHKLSPRSSLCIFLGYSTNHKGYRCLDLHSNRIFVSRHVVFDESFPPFLIYPPLPCFPPPWIF